MKFEYKSSLALIVVVSLIGLSGCSSDSDDDPKRATIVPGINPAFDTVDEVATSVAADGIYEPLIKGDDYTYADETITFKEDFIARAIFVRVTGKATFDGIEDSYTVYTYVINNTTAIAANELTSIAVLDVAQGVFTNFSVAIDKVAEKTGLSSSILTTATKSTKRSKDLIQSMRTLASLFQGNGALAPGDSAPSTLLKPEELEKIARGAHAYDNWLQVCDPDISQLACVEDKKPSTPTEVIVKTSDTGFSTFVDFVRCKSCHGWDMLGEGGGFAFRTPKIENDYRIQPNVGPNISAANRDADRIARTAVTARYANNTPSNDVLSAADWNAIVDDSVSSKHPNFSSTSSNSVVPSAEIIDELVAFLNFEDAAASQVFFSITPDSANETVDYTLVTTADADRGAKYYAAWCFRCHGAPDNSNSNPLRKFQIDNFMAYLDENSRLSKLRHIAQWGKAGTSMIRARLGYPNASNVADIIAFLREAKVGTRTSGDGFDIAKVGDKLKGKTKYDAICAKCHKAKEYDTSALCFDSSGDKVNDCSGDSKAAPDLTVKHFGMQRDLGEVSKIMKNVGNLSQQEINDLFAFLTSDTVDSAPSQ